MTAVLYKFIFLLLIIIIIIIIALSVVNRTCVCEFCTANTAFLTTCQTTVKISSESCSFSTRPTGPAWRWAEPDLLSMCRVLLQLCHILFWTLRYVFVWCSWCVAASVGCAWSVLNAAEFGAHVCETINPVAITFNFNVVLSNWGWLHIIEIELSDPLFLPPYI